MAKGKTEMKVEITFKSYVQERDVLTFVGTLNKVMYDYRAWLRSRGMSEETPILDIRELDND